MSAVGVDPPPTRFFNGLLAAVFLGPRSYPNPRAASFLHGPVEEAIMSHPTGERLRCDECGAEIVFVKPCPCPEHDPKEHRDMCCGNEMRSLGIDSVMDWAQPGAGH